MGEQQAPVTISIVGTGTGDGGGVAPTPTGTVATTPGTQPNLLINVITPAVALAVRFAHLFLTTFLGLLTVAGVGGVDTFGASDLYGAMQTCAWSALVVAGIGFLKDAVTIFSRLEGKYPLQTGSI